MPLSLSHDKTTNYRQYTPTVIHLLNDETSLLQQFGSGGAFVSNAAVAQVETFFGPQSSSIRIYCGTGDSDGAGTVAGRIGGNISSTDMRADRCFSFRVFMSTDSTLGWGSGCNPDRLYKVRLYLGSDSDTSFDNQYYCDFFPKQHLSSSPLGSSGWIAADYMAHAVFHKDDFQTLAGSPDWSDIQSWRIEVTHSGGTGLGTGPGGGSDLSVVVSELYRNTRSKPIILITHDDGGSGIYDNGLAIMDRYGLKTTQFVVPDFIETGGANMNLAEIQEMYAAGHDMCLHCTYSGDVLNTMTDSEASADLALGLQYLVDNNIDRAKHIVSWPQGVESTSENRAWELFAAQGIRVARGSRVYPTNICANDLWTTLDITGNEDATATNMSMTINSITESNYTDVDNMITFAKKYGGISVFNLHNVVSSGATGAQINADSADYFYRKISEAQLEGSAEVMTMSEVFNEDGTIIPAYSPETTRFQFNQYYQENNADGTEYQSGDIVRMDADTLAHFVRKGLGSALT